MSSFQTFSAGGHTITGSQTNKKQQVNPLYPPDVEDDQPQDNALYPPEIYANDKAKEFKKNLAKYRKLCKAVSKIDEVENGKNDVEPMLPPMIKE